MVMTVTRLDGRVSVFRIEGARNLDPVTVVTVDDAPGKGLLMVSCYGRSWQHYWAAMYSFKSVKEFVAVMEDANYLAMKLSTGDESQSQLDYLHRVASAVVDAMVDLVGRGEP